MDGKGSNPEDAVLPVSRETGKRFLKRALSMKARNGFLIAAFACTVAQSQAPAAGDSGSNQEAPLQERAAPSDQSASVQLTPKTENGITYLCGGIGTAEAEQMKREAANYNLMLTFAENNGAYVANVQVEIADARGKPILETVCDAPIMLVNLPTARSYRIRAEVAGHPVKKTVRVRPGRRGTAVGITWPSGLSGVSDPDLQGLLPPG
jgi:hypothetical protein